MKFSIRPPPACVLTVILLFVLTRAMHCVRTRDGDRRWFHRFERRLFHFLELLLSRHTVLYATQQHIVTEARHFRVRYLLSTRHAHRKILSFIRLSTVLPVPIP